MNNKIKFFATMLTCILLSINLAWGDTYTITFATNSGDGTKASTSTAASTCTTAATYVTGNLVTASNVYYGGSDGLKLGTKSGAGDIKINLSTSGQVVPTSVVVYAKYYSSSKIGTVQVVTNLGSNTATNTTGSFTAYTYSYSGSTKLSWVEIKSNKYIWVEKVVVTYTAAAPTYTLKVSDGTGGYTTYSNKVKSDLTEATAMGGNSCTDGLQGAYSGWRTSSLETPAGSPGTTYNHATAGDMPASGSTLYAVYYSYGEGGYLTNTFCEPTCANTVTVGTGASTNGSITLSSTSVTTCGDAASRQVTVSVAPNTCYAGPADATVISKTGTAASSTSYVSGPTWNGSTSKYDYVYQFTQNASGAVNFAVTLSTKTTYTVQYAEGDVPSGGGSISGSHANDTKTCGTAMTLPAASFTTTGYTQTGWSKTNGGSQYAAVGGSYTDNAAQTFYPVWTANKYTVTWSVNGSTYTTTANVSYNTTTATPANPSVPVECTGSTFMGWTATQNYTGNSAPANMFNGTSPTITGDITFYAVFADEN